MNRTLTAVAIVACAALAACSSKSGPTSSPDTKPKATTSKQATVTASSAMTAIAAKVPTAKQFATVTAANDPNHLLGRPSQYTSKVTFTDTRIKASEVTDSSKGSVDLGGAIEVFASPADATARAKYIETVTKSVSALTEYDYVHGTVLVRVSHYLTPSQAAEYKTVANGLS
ncbi:hypothetical protein ACFY2T_41100 [Streptomyces sp. NPDC001260]|uniref:hypothetical protein n=1 Tax=Streptomyces sp. NPDC001260 TaxID=3364551 RepID=UPI003690D2C2